MKKNEISNSFLLYTNEKIDELLVSKFHLNIWSINSYYFRMEYGILFNIPKDGFPKIEDIKFSLITPFPVYKDNISTVYQDLLNDDNISLIFNDKCLGINDCSNKPNSSYASIIKFKNQQNFILIKPKLSQNNHNKSKILFTIDTKNINLDQYKSNTNINFYVRFNSRVDYKKCDNIIRKRNLSNDYIIFDIRLNDIRVIHKNDFNENDNIIAVKSFYVFIINDIKFKPRLLNNDKLKYRRILEKELFKKYIKELKRSPLKYIIHYWRFEEQNKNLETANLAISFEKEISLRIISVYSLVINIIVALIFSYLSDSFKFINSIPIIIFITIILILVWFLPTWLLKIYNNLWISKINKNN